MTKPDLPEGIRILSDEEVAQLPPSDDPGAPDEAQDQERRRQVVEEQEKGHPAFDTVVPEE